MKTRLARATLSSAAVVLALGATPSEAIAPVIALLGKQMLQEMFTSTLKSALLDSLSGLGCKGTALANAINSLDVLKGGAAGLPRGMPSMPTGMPNIPTMPSMPGMAGIPGMGGLPGMPGVAGMSGMAGMPGAGMAGVPPEMAAMMARMVPGGGLDADQSAMLAKLMGGMGAPLSPLETIATIDEMSELGLLSKAMNTELKECMLVLPQSAPALGMGMGMMRSMLPKFREARDQMLALSPTEQDELAASLAHEFDKVPAADRKNMLTELRGGLFPPRVVDALTKRYGGK